MHITIWAQGQFGHFLSFLLIFQNCPFFFTAFPVLPLELTGSSSFSFLSGLSDFAPCTQEFLLGTQGRFGPFPFHLLQPHTSFLSSFISLFLLLLFLPTSPFRALLSFFHTSSILLLILLCVSFFYFSCSAGGG